MKKITIIGGDRRLQILKNSLTEMGYLVDSLGLEKDDTADIKTSRFIVLPVPTTKDGKNVFTPFSEQTIPLSFIAQQTTRDQLILCCNYIFENKTCVDYGSLDSYALLNSVPTAEGAIMLAIQNTPWTLWKSRALVIGYGRVGKILSDRLKNLGCDVTVSARKPADFAMLDALGFKTVHTSHLNDKPLEYDIVFNTVDVKVLEDKSFKNTPLSLIIDLSSLGGFNMAAAEENGIKTIKAPGLPGKVAPETAAEILCGTITHIINSYN